LVEVRRHELLAHFSRDLRALLLHEHLERSEDMRNLGGAVTSGRESRLDGQSLRHNRARTCAVLSKCAFGSRRLATHNLNSHRSGLCQKWACFDCGRYIVTTLSLRKRAAVHPRDKKCRALEHAVFSLERRCCRHTRPRRQKSLRCLTG
jgi:hypothetical protein